MRLQTKNQKLNVTAFGILFGFDRAGEGLEVQSVLKMLQENWWREAMVESKDTNVFIIREWFRI